MQTKHYISRVHSVPSPWWPALTSAVRVLQEKQLRDKERIRRRHSAEGSSADDKSTRSLDSLQTRGKRAITCQSHLSSFAATFPTMHVHVSSAMCCDVQYSLFLVTLIH